MLSDTSHTILQLCMLLCAIQISGKPAPRGGTRGRSLGNFPHPWSYHSLDSMGVKSDNPRGGILENFGAHG